MPGMCEMVGALPGLSARLAGVIGLETESLARKILIAGGVRPNAFVQPSVKPTAPYPMMAWIMDQ